MKKKIFKIVGGVIFIVVLIVIAELVHIYFTEPISVYKVEEFKYNGEPNLSKVLSKEEVSEDIENIIDIIESTHPIFLEKVPDSYYEAKDRLREISGESISVGDLQGYIAQYLSVLDDGHTALWWQENRGLDIEWKYIDGSLLLVKNNKLTDKKVTKIGNIDIDEVISTVKESFPAENDVAQAKNIEEYSKGKLLLEKTGLNYNGFIIITVEGSLGEDKLQVEFGKGNNKIVDYSIYSKIIDDNTLYIKLGVCELNPSLDKVIDDINNYLNNGVTNFIIDVADNPGGNSQACTKILEALKITPGSYGSVIRFSELAQEQRGYIRNSGSIKFKSNNNAIPNEDINLYVITNENTFSSAQMLAVWVSDGNLGTIVGRASSNKPSSYGDIIYFQLENSKLKGSVSHKKWVRPDITKDKESTLEPDIYIDYGEDSLKKVLEEIKGN
ncbi:S41 family peptidase [Clostridioides difficile]